MSIVGVIGDTHEPYTAKGYLEFCQRTFDHYGVDLVIHIGDLVDNHSLGFHDSEPLLHSITGEWINACEKLQGWYQAFPDLVLIQGNHDRIPARQLRKLGMEPSIFMKPLEDIFEMPRGWKIMDSIMVDDVLYHHGETATGVNGFRLDAERRMCCTVTGHNHSNAGISATATPQELVWGMAVGCGVDAKHMAFAYGKNFQRKPVISCGVVHEGEPVVEFMDLGKRIRRIYRPGDN